MGKDKTNVGSIHKLERKCAKTNDSPLERVRGTDSDMQDIKTLNRATCAAAMQPRYFFRAASAHTVSSRFAVDGDRVLKWIYERNWICQNSRVSKLKDVTQCCREHLASESVVWLQGERLVVELDGGVEVALEVQREAEGRVRRGHARVDRERRAVPAPRAAPRPGG